MTRVRGQGGRLLGLAGTLLSGLTVATAGAVVVAGRRWDREAARAAERLQRAPRDASIPATFELRQVEGLPAPAARYFRFALTPGRPLYRSARFEQVGEFAIRPGEWRPMRAEQRFSIDPPGFVWNASIRLGPGLAMRVLDGYQGGAATMHGAVGGLVTIVNQRNTPGLAEGALLRWLAEAPWLPAALLSARGMRWTPIDDSTARATLVDAGLTVSMDAHFGPGSEITRITAQRYRDVNGRAVLTPFEGRFADYRPVDGMMIPTRIEGTWLLPEGPHPYFRARLSHVVYQDGAPIAENVAR